MGIGKLQNLQAFNSFGLKAISSNLKFSEGDFLEIFLKLLGESSETSDEVKTAEKLDRNSLFSNISPINLLFLNEQVEYGGENISGKTLNNFPNDILKDLHKNTINSENKNSHLSFLPFSFERQLDIPQTNNEDINRNNKHSKISAENLGIEFNRKSLGKEYKPIQIDSYILNRQDDIKISESKDLQPKNLGLKDGDVKQYKNDSREVSNEDLNLFDEINFENLGINIKPKLHNKVEKVAFYNPNLQTEAVISKNNFEKGETKNGEIYHAVQVEIKELPQEKIKVQESEKSLMLKDFRIFERDGEKRVAVKFNELGFEIRFLQDTAKLKFTLNQQLANFITSYDAVKISHIFQSLGVKLESVNINGQEIYSRDKNKDRGNIRVDGSTHKSNNTSGYNSSFSVLL